MSAQEEADALLHRKEKPAVHPEDQHPSSEEEPEDDEEDINKEEVDDDDEGQDIDMLRRAYHIPSTVFDANTGPKGVIADAQAFERARKRSLRRTLFDYREKPQPALSAESDDSEEDQDERFMREWREARMLELQTKAARRPSPSKRRFGSLDTVDANGYLDAIEKVAPGTVVVVCIYDPDCRESSIVEDSLASLARKQATTHFVKLHYEIAEMDHITAPALIAYRNGDVFATVIDVLSQLPGGRPCSSASIEDLLMLHKIL